MEAVERASAASALPSHHPPLDLTGGQESAGIASFDASGIHTHKGMGLVSQVFTEADIDALRGACAVGMRAPVSGGGGMHLCALQMGNAPSTPPRHAGPLAIGHTRYSTSGGSKLVAAQPFVLETDLGQLAIAHNGQVARASELRRLVLNRGVGLFTNRCVL